MRRRAVLFLALAAAPAARAEEDGPAAPIARLDDALLQIMRMAHAAPFEQRVAVLGPVVAQVFDLPQILQVSVGLRWPSFPPAEQAKLLDVFTRYTVASYVANFDSYDGQRFEILPQTRAVGADRVVATQLVPRSGDPTRLDYQMRHGAAGWRVVDVLLDGSISRVAVQRSDFRSLIGSGGPERLIASLQRKVANLQSGNS
ncbi:MAG: ABC transporter substrate-binding protein [Rhodospirillales bacterium]|nr:ABC transporter substrate-binding protein [Rhodospirillales bacterium]